MEELVKFTLLTHGHASYLTDRYSERRADATTSRQVERLVDAAVKTL
jgi:arsenic resistance protein ArsH